MFDLRTIEDALVLAGSTNVTLLDENATRLMAIAMRLEAATLRDAAAHALTLDERAATHERAHTLEQLTERILGRRVRLLCEDDYNVPTDELEVASDDQKGSQ